MNIPEAAPWQWQIAVAVIVAVLTLIGAIASALAARFATERKTMIDRLTHLEKRQDDLVSQRAQDWIAFQKKHQEDAIIKRAMGDHIDALEHHIWQGKPPPPPPRPPGI